MASTRDLILRFEADTAKLKSSTAEVSKTLDKTAGNAGKAGGAAASGYGEGFGSKIKSVAKSIAGPLAALFAADKIKDFGVDSVNAASDLQETMSKSEAIFGKNAGAIEKWASSASTSFGLSKEQALAAAAGFGDMFLQIGFTGKEATAASKNVVGMAADLGSFNNLETDDVLDRISAAMRGEYDSLQAVIPNINAARVEKEALAATGKENAKQLTAEEKAQATLAIVQKDGARAMGDFAKTSGGMANQQKILAAQFEDLKARVGTALLPVVTAFFNFLNTTGIPALNALGGAIKGGVAWVQKYKDVLLPLGTALGVATLAMAAFSLQQKIMAAGGFLTWLKNLQAVTKVATAFQWLYNAALTANPIGLIVAAIAGLVAGLVIFFTKTETGRKVWAKFTGFITGAAKAVVGWFKNTLIPFFTETLPAGFRKSIEWIRAAWKKVSGLLLAPFRIARDGIGKAWGKIKGGFSAAKNWVSGTWRKGWGAVKGWIGGAVEKGRDAVGKAMGAASGIRQKFNGLKTWAGGTFKKGWQAAKGWISDPIGSAKKTIDTHKGNIQKTFNALDGWGKKIFGPKWDKIKDKLKNPIDTTVKTYKHLFGAKGPIRRTFNGFITAAGKIFGKLKGAVTAPIKAVINAVNKHLIKGGINWILGKLGVKKENMVPWIPVPKFATGGPIRGVGGPRQDRTLIAASPGEFMQPYDTVQHYGLGTMERLRRKQIPKDLLVHGYAGGGLIGGSGTWTDDATRALRAASTRAGVDFSVFQRGFRPSTSYSGTSHAADAIDTGPVRDAVWRALRDVGWAAWDRTGRGNWAPHIHAVPIPGKGVGRPGGSGVWQAEDYLGGGDGLGGRDYHSYRPGVSKGGILGAIAGAVGGALDFLKGVAPIDWLLKKAGEVGGTVGGGAFGSGIAGTIPKMIINRAKEWILEKIGGIAGWAGGDVGGFGQDQLDNAATIMGVSRRLGFGERGALIGLITAMQESTLRNLSYGDRDSVGLFQQRAPWGSFADRTDPAKAAQMFYLGGQGGQPGLKSKAWRTLSPGAAAQAVQVSAYPGLYAPHIPAAQKIIAASKLFDSGGILRPGLTLAYNGTGQNETVRTARQEAALRQAPTVINIRVDGTINDDRTISNLIRAIDQHQRRRGPVRLTRATS